MKILIAGLAKTGTTGLHYLIANSIGKGPKLLFEPTECPEEYRTGSRDVIAKVLIGSNLKVASFAHFDKKITIVRDPRDRIISSLLYSQFHAEYLKDDASVKIVRDYLERKEADPSGVSIKEFFAVVASVSKNPRIEKTYLNWSTQPLSWFDEYASAMPGTFFYKYEDFVSGNYAPLEAYLEMPLSGEAEVPEQLSRVERTKGYGDWRNWFTEKDVALYRPLIDPWLAKYDYDPEDWALNADPVIKKEHCSEYFMRLVGEARKHAAKSGGAAPAEVNRQSPKKLMTGTILRAEPRMVAGWAIGNDPAQPVQVALSVNGAEIAQTLADKPRNGLKEKGVHPTGICGFVFRFPPGKALQVGDKVAVYPVDKNFDLQNSPKSITVETSEAEA